MADRILNDFDQTAQQLGIQTRQTRLIRPREQRRDFNRSAFGTNVPNVKQKQALQGALEQERREEAARRDALSQRGKQLLSGPRETPAPSAAATPATAAAQRKPSAPATAVESAGGFFGGPAGAAGAAVSGRVMDAAPKQPMPKEGGREDQVGQLFRDAAKIADEGGLMMTDKKAFEQANAARVAKGMAPLSVSDEQYKSFLLRNATKGTSRQPEWMETPEATEAPEASGKSFFGQMQQLAGRAVADAPALNEAALQAAEPKAEPAPLADSFFGRLQDVAGATAESRPELFAALMQEQKDRFARDKSPVVVPEAPFEIVSGDEFDPESGVMQPPIGNAAGEARKFFELENPQSFESGVQKQAQEMLEDQRRRRIGERTMVSDNRASLFEEGAFSPRRASVVESGPERDARRERNKLMQKLIRAGRRG